MEDIKTKLSKKLENDYSQYTNVWLNLKPRVLIDECFKIAAIVSLYDWCMFRFNQDEYLERFEESTFQDWLSTDNIIKKLYDNYVTTDNCHIDDWEDLDDLFDYTFL